MATLHLHIPGSGIVSHELSGKQTVTIGGAPDNAIQIQDSSVSPHHAEILCEAGGFRLRDVGSANKCWLNGVAVVDAVFHDGDSLRFGMVESLFLLQPSSGEKPGVEPALRGRLVLSIPGHGETVFRFEGALATVGWKSDNDLRIKDPSVSGHHAQFIEAKGRYRLKDLRSTNKTLLNGQAIDEAEVNNGDRVQFGAVAGVFKAEYGIRRVSAPVLADASTSAAAKALAAEVEEWKAKNEALDKEHESLRFHNQQLSTQLKETAAQADKLKAALETTAAQAQEKLAAATAERETAAQRIQEISARLETLQQERGELETKLTAGAHGNQEQLARIATLTQERDALQAKATETQGTLAAQIEEWKANYEALRKERDGSDAENKQLTSRLKEAVALGDELKASLQAREQTVAQTSSAAQQEAERLSGELAQARSRCDALSKERDALQTTAAEAQGKLTALTQERDALQTMAADAQEKLAALTQERDALQSTAADAQGKLAALAQERDALQSMAADVQGKLAALTQERDALQSTAADAQGKLAALTQERDALQTTAADVQEKLAALTQERDALQTTAADAQGKLAALTQERDALQTTAADAQGKLTALTQERDALQSTAAEAQGKLTALTQERDALQSTAAEAQGKLTALTQERDALQTMAADAQEKLAALTQERDALQSTAAEAQGKLAALTQERDALQSMAADVQGKLAALTQERDALQASASRLAEAPRHAQSVQEQKPVPAASATTPSVSDPAWPRPLSLLREGPLPPVEGAKTGLIEINTAGSPIARFSDGAATGCDADSPSIQKIVENAPEALNGMRRCLHAFIKSQTEISLLNQLLSGLHELTEQTVQANLTSVATFSFALERLIDDLMKIPGQINPSSLRTVSQSIDFLVTLLDGKNLFRTKQPDLANIFAVDDDLDACKTICGAIEMVNLKVVCAGDAKATLAALDERQFDLVLIDVGLPEMNGFELCTRLRKLPNYKKIPVVFITGAVTVQNRVQSSLSGGNDFIAKPFNLLELGVKALIWIFKGQLGMV